MEYLIVVGVVVMMALYALIIARCLRRRNGNKNHRLLRAIGSLTRPSAVRRLCLCACLTNDARGNCSAIAQRRV